VTANPDWWLVCFCTSLFPCGKEESKGGSLVRRIKSGKGGNLKSQQQGWGLEGRKPGQQQAGERPACLQLSLNINLFLTEKSLCSQLRANNDGGGVRMGTGVSCILKRNVKYDLQITGSQLSQFLMQI
jgi:hypothetical protein